MSIEIEDSREGGPVTEGFKDMLLDVVSRTYHGRKPPIEALLITEALVEGDLDKLDMNWVKKVWNDAGLFFKKETIEIHTEPNG